MNTLKDYVNFKLTHADKVAEAEGYPLTMQNCKKYKKMKDLKVYGNSLQDGTPTPDAPVEVVSVGEKSVNLFDKDNVKYSNLIYLSTIGKFVTADNSNVRMYYIECTPNTTYTYSKSLGIYNGLYSSESIPDNGVEVTNVSNNGTITTGANDKYLAIYPLSSSELDTISYGEIEKDIQIQLGTTATPYEPYGKYKIPVVQRGINLFSMAKVNAESKTVSGLTFTPLDDERVYVKGTATANAYYYMYAKATKNMVLKSGTYKSKPFKKSEISILFNMRYMDGTGAGNLNSMHSGVTYNNDIYIESALVYVAKGTVMDDIIELQLMEGTENLPYEPYIEPVTTNIFLDEPLRKLGDYADYIDFKENKVVRKIKEVVFKGGEVTNKYTSYESSLGYTLFHTPHNKYPDVNMINFEKYDGHPELSTHFKAETRLDSSKIKDGEWYVFRFGIWIAFDVGKYETPAEVNAWLTSQYENGTPVTFNYILAEPTEEPLNIDLPKLTTKTTIIEVDTSLAPSNIYGKYIKK